MNLKHISLFLLSASLAACGGSGSTTATSATAAATTASVATDTPMSTLVVPETMKWVTSSQPTLQISVKDNQGAVAAGASVSLFTFTMTGPQGEALSEPVAMDPIDNAVTDASGQVSFPALLPGHMTQVLVVSSMGAQSAKQVLDVSSLSSGINLSLN